MRWIHMESSQRKTVIHWWFDDLHQQHHIQLNEVTEFPYNDTYICAYVKIEDIDIQYMSIGV